MDLSTVTLPSPSVPISHFPILFKFSLIQAKGGGAVKKEEKIGGKGSEQQLYENRKTQLKAHADYQKSGYDHKCLTKILIWAT